MPILDLEIVVRADETVPPGLPAAIADAAAAVFGTARGQTWVRLHELARECYAEDGGPLDPDVEPVFVHVLQVSAPHESVRERQAAALAAAVAAALRRRVENVHIVFEPPGAGRVAFGGKLLTRAD